MRPPRAFRAYLIDPATRTVEAFAFQSGNLPDLYSRIGTRNLDHATLRRRDGGMVCIWVDGEGYYKPGLRWWSFAGYPNPLVGRGIMTGADPKGEDDDVPIPLDQMIEAVEWNRRSTEASRRVGLRSGRRNR